MPGHPVRDRGEHDVQLDERGTAEAVDHDQHVAGQRRIGVDGRQRDLSQLPGRYQRAAATAGFAIDVHIPNGMIFTIGT